jgi:hypothetical protein
MMRHYNRDREEIGENLARREGQYLETPKAEDLDFRTCSMCTHKYTCDILKESARFISQNYDEENHKEDHPTIPFKYDQLAKICNFFEFKPGSKSEELFRK